MVKSRYIGDGHPTFNRNPYNGYINPYYWVDDHPLLYANNGSLDPGTLGNDSLTIKLTAQLIRVLQCKPSLLGSSSANLPFQQTNKLNCQPTIDRSILQKKHKKSWGKFQTLGNIIELKIQKTWNGGNEKFNRNLHLRSPKPRTSLEKNLRLEPKKKLPLWKMKFIFQLGDF